MPQTRLAKAPKARRRSGVRRILISSGVLAIALYLGALAWLMTQETRLLFRADQPFSEGHPSVQYEQIDLPRTDGARQVARILRNADDLPWLLYLHGNQSTIASHVNVIRCENLRALGLNVLAPEYRGFGGLEGVPSESAVATDARAAYDYLLLRRGVPADRIVVYGWSLGAAIAVELASAVPQAALILEGAPASVAAIGQMQYPIFPIRLVMRNAFDAISKIGRVEAPVLFLHSPEDAEVPITEGRRLYEAARSARTFVEVRGGHIRSSEVDGAAFYGAIGKFLAAHKVLAGPKVDPSTPLAR